MSYLKYEYLCKTNNVSTAKVCRDTGISPQTISAWKKGEYIPKADKRKKIANYFGVTLEYLDGDDIEEATELTEEKGLDAVLDMRQREFEAQSRIREEDERFVIKFRKALSEMPEEKKELLKANMETMYKALGIDTDDL